MKNFLEWFEKAPVGGTTTASLGSAVREVTWVKTPQGDAFAFPWPGTGSTLIVDHTGIGHPRVTLEARAAISLKVPLASGYRLTKSLVPVGTSPTGRCTRGDIVRVRLETEADLEGRRLACTSLEDISPALQAAVIAFEDRRFYRHGGVDT